MNRELSEDQSAFLESLPEKYEKMLFQYCARCVSYNPNIMPFIPDLLQEVYLKASLNVESLMHHENIPGWLKKSCHFSLLTMLRNQRNNREILCHFLNDLSTAETAKLNRMTYDTVRGKISQIRKKLKNHFGKDG